MIVLSEAIGNGSLWGLWSICSRWQPDWGCWRDRLCLLRLSNLPWGRWQTLGQLTLLNLTQICIGDDGMQAFASAVASGALLSLR